MGFGFLGFLLENTLKFVGLIISFLICLFLMENKHIFALIIVAALITTMPSIIKEKREKRIYYPVTDVKMTEEQKIFVLSQLFKVRYRQEALEYSEKIKYDTLENKDLESLNNLLNKVFKV